MGKLDGVDLSDLPKGKHGDGHGLWLIKMSKGSGSWMLRVAVSGKLRHLGLGAADVVSLQDARDAATKYRRALHHKGLFNIAGDRNDERKFHSLVNEAMNQKEKEDDF
jgi:hypothetical protein